MYLCLVKSVVMDQYSEQLRKIKSLLIVTSLQKRRDVIVFELIRNMEIDLNWSNTSGFLIDQKAWQYAILEKGYDPKLIFCHPDVLILNPVTSLYYRGITGLSIKSAKDYFGSVENLEKQDSKARISPEKARKMSQVYNTFISTIINGSSDWTLENGKRTLIATLGITIDGVMRNKVGAIAEERIRSMIFEWLVERDLLLSPHNLTDDITEGIPLHCELKNELVMQFSSEPDVSFYKKLNDKNELVAAIEIKGGIDPAGALERYGAATKSFQHALKENQRCKNFLLAAVFTPELEKRIKKDRLVDEY